MTPHEAHPLVTPREVELKYRVTDPDRVRGLLERPAIGPFRGEGPAATVGIVDRFFDTDDGIFRTRRYALRVRRIAGATIATIKGPAAPGPGGAVSRLELEVAVDDPDPATWPASPARDLALAIGGGRPVHEIVRIAQVRRQRLLRASTALVELSLDDVEVRDGDRALARWIELEAEVRDGDPMALEELDRALVAGGGLAPATESKLATALRAIDVARASPG